MSWHESKKDCKSQGKEKRSILIMNNDVVNVKKNLLGVRTHHWNISELLVTQWIL